jgi:hypothetical protein
MDIQGNITQHGVPPHCLPGGIEENHKLLVRIACLQVKVRIKGLLNIKQECHHSTIKFCKKKLIHEKEDQNIIHSTRYHFKKNNGSNQCKYNHC